MESRQNLFFGAPVPPFFSQRTESCVRSVSPLHQQRPHPPRPVEECDNPTPRHRRNIMPRIRILLLLTSPPLLLLLPLLLPASTSAFSFPANPARRPITPSSVVPPLLRATSSSSSYSSYAERLSRIPVVICPGFGNDSIDYVSPLGRGSEYGLVSALSRRGFNPDLIRVLPLDRIEWLRVAGGVLDVPDFYAGTCRPTGLGYGWYVRRLRETIQKAYDDGGGGGVGEGGGGRGCC